ncbi:MAG TPA: GNAT family N-acetyltransferase [Mycobacteriales bacterium]|nr:GNAT family N-acetyltransferase [Mycobacteriales bacterium]
MADIAYRLGDGDDLDLDAVIDLYRASTLGLRRPVEERDRMTSMLRHANLVVTAWAGAQLVGIARSLTDWDYTTYLADLAVHLDFQRGGIGRELILRTRAATHPKASLVLLAAPAAEEYYPRIGMRHHASAWVLREGDRVL